MDVAGDYFHDVPMPVSQSANPNWPDTYLTDLYRTHLHLEADQDLIGSQNKFALSLPGIFLLFCNETNTSPDHPLPVYQEPVFWDFVTKYSMNSNEALRSLQPDPQPEQPTLAAWSSGSIQLFPPCAPSQLPAPPVHPAAASAVLQGTSAGFPFRAVPPGAAGLTGSAPVPPPPVTFLELQFSFFTCLTNTFPPCDLPLHPLYHMTMSPDRLPSRFTCDSLWLCTRLTLTPT